MKFTLHNKDLQPLVNVLDHLVIKNMKVNRGRAKLYSSLTRKLDEYAEDEKDILSEVAVINDDGSFNFNDEGNIVLKGGVDYVKVNADISELADEDVVLDAGEYQARYTAFFEWLADCEEEFTTTEVILIDNLLEQFEEQEGE